MKPGDLVKHKANGKIYIVTLDNTSSARNLAPVVTPAGVRWIHKAYLEVINESKRT